MSTVVKSRSARLERLTELIRNRQIHSQGDLLQLLKRDGVVVTQATLSRDLDELGAIKVRDTEGFLCYALPSEAPEAVEGSRVVRLITELVLHVDRSGDLVMVRTPPGGAQLLAGAVDRFIGAGEETLLVGTVAGDDTILIVARENQGKSVMDAVRKIAEGHGGPDLLKRRSKGAKK